MRLIIEHSSPSYLGDGIIELDITWREGDGSTTVEHRRFTAAEYESFCRSLDFERTLLGQASIH